MNLEFKVELSKNLSVASRLYQLDRPLIGLTGSIATGKSTVTKYLINNYNFKIICADSLVKEIYTKAEVIEWIGQLVPSCKIGNKLDFAILRKAFFSDTKIKNEVEKKIYSLLSKAFLDKTEEYKDQPFVFYDIPLLFERKFEQMFDLTICVWTSKKEQIKRVIARDKIDQHLALEIINKQIDIDQKKKLADIFFDNSKDLNFLYLEIQQKLIHQFFN